jgi:hypothetical protein
LTPGGLLGIDEGGVVAREVHPRDGFADLFPADGELPDVAALDHVRDVAAPVGLRAFAREFDLRRAANARVAELLAVAELVEARPRTEIAGARVVVVAEEQRCPLGQLDAAHVQDVAVGGFPVRRQSAGDQPGFGAVLGSLDGASSFVVHGSSPSK